MFSRLNKYDKSPLYDQQHTCFSFASKAIHYYSSISTILSKSVTILFFVWLRSSQFYFSFLVGMGFSFKVENVDEIFEQTVTGNAKKNKIFLFL